MCQSWGPGRTSVPRERSPPPSGNGGCTIHKGGEGGKSSMEAGVRMLYWIAMFKILFLLMVGMRRVKVD